MGIYICASCICVERGAASKIYKNTKAHSQMANGLYPGVSSILYLVFHYYVNIYYNYRYTMLFKQVYNCHCGRQVHYNLNILTLVPKVPIVPKSDLLVCCITILLVREVYSRAGAVCAAVL